MHSVSSRCSFQDTAMANPDTKTQAWRQTSDEPGEHGADGSKRDKERNGSTEERYSLPGGRLMLETKQESWVWLIGWVKRLPERHPTLTDFSAFVSPLLQTCVEAGLDQYFRAGQSMSHIIFSTAEEHRLEKYDPPPPRVTLRFDETRQQWIIAWSYKNLHFSNADREDIVISETVLAVLKAYLTDLWRETQPDESLPAPLAVTQ
jgi:hypothetical protein